MRLTYMTVAACATIAVHGTALATVQIHGALVDGLSSLQSTEVRPVSHSLSLTRNRTSVTATGDLSTGVLRAVAISRTESGAPNDLSVAAIDVTVSDLVTFAQGASGTGYFDWGFDGSFDFAPDKPAPYSGGGAYLNFNLTPPSGGASGARLATVTPDSECSGAPAPYCVTGPFLHTEVAMRGSLPFEIRPGTFTLGFSLGAYVRGGDIADFGNTTYLYLRLPAGVDFTSGSGVFLANALPVPPPVPEPSTALLIVCGGLGLVATRRWTTRRASPGRTGIRVS